MGIGSESSSDFGNFCAKFGVSLGGGAKHPIRPAFFRIFTLVCKFFTVPCA
jgi:hypothetical protein